MVLGDLTLGVDLELGSSDREALARELERGGL
jgi:hypothetical protein